MKVCPNCGEENPDRFRLCGFCGSQLAVVLPPQEVRKTVTIVFSDLKGSTSLGEALDSEALREVMSRYFDEMRAVLERHGGTVEKYIGDAIMAVFGLPRVHEDDAVRAVRAAMAMKEALARLNDELDRAYGVRLANRTGVNTGEVVAGDPTTGQRLVTGDTVNTAARLEQAAPALEVLIGEPTYRLVRGLAAVEPVEPLELKGKAERVPAYRLLSVGEGRLEQAHESPMIGRSDELARLRAALAAAAEQRVARLATIVADAGVGKSRLTEEFCDAVDDALVLRGRCLSYGRGITFWPLVEMVREGAGIVDGDGPDAAQAKLVQLVGGAEDVAARVGAAVGLSAAEFALPELFWGVRKLLEHLAADRPLVLVIEDIHWAEGTFLDLIEHVLENAGARILLLCAARPILEEHRPSWGSSPRAERIELLPLSDDESGVVIEHLLGGAELPPAVRRRVTEAAEGNPLFVEQLLSMLIDDGYLRRTEDGGWTTEGELTDVAVPPTIQALLAARLDLLAPEERAVVEPASVIGLTFPREAVEALVPEAIRDQVGAWLDALTRKQLVRPDTASGAGVLRFNHILIRDAAYQGLLKRTRATLHERFVDWAEKANRDGRETEYEEIHGYHLEQAHRYLFELGLLDDHGRALATRASGKLAGAGRRAFGRGDMAAASNLLRRAVDLLPEHDPRRLPLLPDLGEAMMEIGEFAWSELYLDEAVDAAVTTGNQALLADALLTRLLVRHHVTEDFHAWSDEVERETGILIPRLEERDEHVQLAKAWRIVAFIHATVCRWEETSRAQRRALEHARLGGLSRQEARLAAAFTIALTHGPTPVPEALSQLDEIRTRGLADRQAEAIALCSLSTLLAMDGEFEAAREYCRQAREIHEDLGGALLATHSLFTSGRVELLAGDPWAAERHLRRDDEALAAMRERYFRPLVLAVLAQTLYEQGRWEEAEEPAALAGELADGDDIEPHAVSRAVRAKILARAGEHESAAELAADALSLAERTDAPLVRTEALVDLAEVLALGGRAAEARLALERALELCTAKAMTAPAAAVERRLAALEHAATPLPPDR